MSRQATFILALNGSPVTGVADVQRALDGIVPNCDDLAGQFLTVAVQSRSSKSAHCLHKLDRACTGGGGW